MSEQDRDPGVPLGWTPVAGTGRKQKRGEGDPAVRSTGHLSLRHRSSEARMARHSYPTVIQDAKISYAHVTGSGHRREGPDLGRGSS